MMNRAARLSERPHHQLNSPWNEHGYHQGHRGPLGAFNYLICYMTTH